MVTFGARGDHPLGSALFDSLQVEFSQATEIIDIPLPEEVVAATTLVFQHHGGDAQAVERLHRAPSDLMGWKAKLLEDDLEVRKTTHEVEGIRSLGHFEPSPEPTQPVLLQLFGHHPHQSLECSAMGALPALAILPGLGSQMPDELRIGHIALTPLAAGLAGQARPEKPIVG
jgi:hypothetical protein